MVMITIDIDNYSSFWQFAQLVVQVVFLGAISHQQTCLSTFYNYDGDGNDDYDSNDVDDDDDDEF